MVIIDQDTNETAARAYSQQGHGKRQADPKAGYISATSRRRAIEPLRTAAGTYIWALSAPSLHHPRTAGFTSVWSCPLPEQTLLRDFLLGAAAACQSVKENLFT
jgi:hypothetical protein